MTSTAPDVRPEPPRSPDDASLNEFGYRPGPRS